MSALKGQDVTQMRCHKEECRLPLRIFASMIPFDAALQLQVSFLLTCISTNLGLPKSILTPQSKGTDGAYKNSVPFSHPPCCKIRGVQCDEQTKARVLVSWYAKFAPRHVMWDRIWGFPAPRNNAKWETTVPESKRLHN